MTADHSAGPPTRHLDFTGSRGDDSGEIDSGLFLVVDDQLTCHVLGGAASE